MYKLYIPFGRTEPIVVQRLADNAFIPLDPANTDYQKYLEWLAEGNEPLPPDEETN
jgi:hypothetical protein